MMNNDNNVQNKENLVNQEASNVSLLEQTKEAEKQEQTLAEIDAMRTKLCHKRVIQKLKDEEGFEIDELAEEKRIAYEMAIENETVKQNVQRRFKEFKESWQDPIKRKVKVQDTISFIAALFRTIILIGLCFVILMPIFEKISYALRAPQDITNQQVVWIPETFSFMNIKIAFTYLTLDKDLSYEGTFLYPISTFFNSVWLSFLTTVIQVIATAIAGYSFARLKFKGNNILFILVIITLIVPAEALQSARQLFFAQTSFFGIHLVRNAIAIYVMSAFGMGLRSAIFIYLFRQFFRGIPIELEESAEIDGAGVIRTFWSVMLPNARGAIVTVALFSFVWQYNDLYWARIFNMHSSSVMPLLTTALANGAESFNSVIGTSFRSLVLEYGKNIAEDPQFYGLILNTSALLMMSPLIIGYLFVQRLFVESIERTGITGM